MILKIARFFLQNRAFSWFLLVLILGGGLFSYVKMGKLEDAPFTIKQAVVLTSYPGASPEEVREQVKTVKELEKLLDMMCPIRGAATRKQ